MEDLSRTILPWVNVLHYGAVGDNVADDTAAFQSALTALGSAGGGDFLIPGGKTYLVDAASLTYPDADVELIWVGGARISRPTSTNPLFVIPDGLTTRRWYKLRNPKVVGGNVADQWFMEFQDTGSNGNVDIYNPDVTQFRNVFNHTSGDVNSQFAAICKVWGGQIVPPGQGTGYLLKTSHPAGVLTPFGVSTYLMNVRIYDGDTYGDISPNNGFTMDYGGDLYISGEEVVFSGACKINGLTMYESACLIGAASDGSDSLECFGRNWDSTTMGSGFLIGLTLKCSHGPGTPAIISAMVLGYGSKIIVNSARARIDNVVQRINSPGTPDYVIDVLAAGVDCQIKGGLFSDASTALVRNATTSLSISGCDFQATGVVNTVLDTGSGDYTLIDDCKGLDSGGGASLGENSEIAGEDAVPHGRLQLDAATQISYQRYNGKSIFVRGSLNSIPTAGHICATTTNLIDATGEDAGAATAVNTLYYAYVSNIRASFAPGGLRLSTTAPSLVRGVRYLGTSGNALNWRFIGWVRTVSNAGTPNFADSLLQRLVINAYNKRKLKMFSCPNYNDNNSSTNYNFADAATWTAINGGTNDHLDFIANGEDAAEFSVHSYVDIADPGDVFRITVAEDVVTAPYGDSSGGQGYISTEGLSQGVTAKAIFNPGTPGFKSALFVATATAAGGQTGVHADEGRYGGATADVPVTYIDGVVWG